MPRLKRRIKQKGKFVSKSIRPARASRQEETRKCARCGHAEFEHGATGRRPCLAMVGDLLQREFCSCGEFRAPLSRAA